MVGNPNFIPSDELVSMSQKMLFDLTGSVKIETKASEVKILHNQIMGVKPMEYLQNL